jgi:hypothetical protein
MNVQQKTIGQLVPIDSPINNVYGFLKCIYGFLRCNGIHEDDLQELCRREEERLRLLKEMKEIVELLGCHRAYVLYSIRDLMDRLGE